MAFERLNDAVDRLSAAVEAAVDHIHESHTSAPADVKADEVATKIETLASKLESRVPDKATDVPATDSVNDSTPQSVTEPAQTDVNPADQPVT